MPEDPGFDPACFNSVLDLLCQCHNVHLASSDQSPAFDVDLQHCRGHVAAAAAAAAAAVAAAVAKAKAKAKAKAAPKPKAKAKAKAKQRPANKSVDLMPSLIRGAHLVDNARTWNAFVRAVESFVDERLVLVHGDPSDEDTAHVESNRALLRQTIWKLADPGARPALENLSEELLSLIGHGPWGPEDPMRHFLSESDRLADAVQLTQLRKDLVKRVCGLIKKLFLNRQPALPSASRWTGAAQAALWNAATLLFFGMQLALLTSMGWTPNVQASLPLASEANEDLLLLLLLMFIFYFVVAYAFCCAAATAAAGCCC